MIFQKTTVTFFWSSRHSKIPRELMHIARDQRMEKVHIGQYPNEMEQTACKTLKYSSREWGFWFLVIEKQSPGSWELPRIWLEPLSTSHIFREIKRWCLTNSFPPPLPSLPLLPCHSFVVQGSYGQAWHFGTLSWTVLNHRSFSQ